MSILYSNVTNLNKGFCSFPRYIKINILKILILYLEYEPPPPPPSIYSILPLHYGGQFAKITVILRFNKGQSNLELTVLFSLLRLTARDLSIILAGCL